MHCELRYVTEFLTRNLFATVALWTLPSLMNSMQNFPYCNFNIALLYCSCVSSRFPTKALYVFTVSRACYMPRIVLGVIIILFDEQKV